MNKGQLINRVQRHMGAGATRSAAQAAVNAVLDSILQEASEQRILLPRLGSFEYTSHEERSAYDLMAACAGALRTTRRLTFRPARRLKERTVGRCHAQPAPTNTPGETK